VANAACADLDAHLALAGLREREIDDIQAATFLLKAGRAHVFEPSKEENE
jgi:hypothetical protein